MAKGVTELLLKITGDNRDAVKSLQSIDGQVSKFGTNVKKAMGAVAAAFAVREVVQFGKDALMAAVDAEEAASAFKTVFGPAIGSVSKFVDEFATKAGFATHELQQMLAITGNIVQGLGATENESALLAETMARLAGDVASFSNAQGGAEAVMGALQSALTGEREALKTYGIVINEADVQTRAFANTGKATAAELTKLEKATATVELAYERAGKAVGDLDRTASGNANQMRELSAVWKETQVAIGEALIPALEALLPLLIAMAEHGDKVGQGIRGVTVTVGALIDEVTGGNPELRTFDEKLRILDQDFSHIQDPIDRATLLLGDFAENGGLTEAALDKIQDTLGLTNVEMHLATEQLLGVSGALDISTKNMKTLETASRSYLSVSGDQNDSWKTGTFELTAYKNQLGPVTFEMDRVAAATRAYTEAQIGANNAALAAVNPFFAAVDAVDRLEQSFNEATADGMLTARELANLGKSSLEARGKLLALGDGSVAGAIRALANAIGIPINEAERLFGSLLKVDGLNVDPNVNVTDNGTTARIHNALLRLNGINTSSSHYSTISTNYVNTYTTRYVAQPFAKGGITPGGQVLVGEEGPELVDLPRGSRVHTNRESQALSRGGTGGEPVHIHLEIDGREIADVVLDQERRELARNGGRL